MNKSQVLKFFEGCEGSRILCLPEENPTEIICELPSDIPNHGIAIAVIDISIPHYHRQTTEVYEVIEGDLKLHLRSHEYEQVVHLTEGDMYIIHPGVIHWAEGEATKVRVITSPPWTKEDHLDPRLDSQPEGRTDLPVCKVCGDTARFNGQTYTCCGRTYKAPAVLKPS